jgi:hypothetical protein
MRPAVIFNMIFKPMRIFFIKNTDYTSILYSTTS